MFRTTWDALFYLSGAVLLLCLLGMTLQFGGGESLPLPVIAVLSGAICLIAYGKKSGNKPVDYARRLESPGRTIGESERNGRNVQSGVVANESVIMGVLVGVGSSSQGDDVEVEFMFHPWRVKGGKTEETRLYVKWPRRISHAMHENFVSDFEIGDSVMEMRVVDLAENDFYEGSKATAVEIVSRNAHDPELARIAALKREPVELEINGMPARFSLDEEEEAFAADIDWNGSEVRLYLETDDSRETATFLQEAGALLADMVGWDRKLREKIASDLLVNERQLLGPEDREKSADEILERLRLEKAFLYGDQLLSFEFQKGDVFPKRTIWVDACLENGPEEARLM